MGSESDPVDGELEIDEQQEAADAAWFRRTVSIPLRRSIVHSLLAGNDTQCFSVEQYKTAFEKECDRIFKTGQRVQWEADDLARSHLLSTGLVEEIRPGIWIAK